MGNFCSNYVFCCCPSRSPPAGTRQSAGRVQEPVTVTVKRAPSTGEGSNRENGSQDLREQQPDNNLTEGASKSGNLPITTTSESKKSIASEQATLEERNRNINEEQTQIIDKELGEAETGNKLDVLGEAETGSKLAEAETGSKLDELAGPFTSAQNLTTEEQMTTAYDESSPSPIRRPLFTATECSRSLLTAPEGESSGGNFADEIVDRINQTADLSKEMDVELHNFSSDSKPSLKAVSDRIITELKETLKRNGSETGKSFPSLKSETFDKKLDVITDTLIIDQELKIDEPASLPTQSASSLTSLEQAQLAVDPEKALATIEYAAQRVPVTNSSTSLATTVSTTSRTSAEERERTSGGAPELRPKSRKKRDKNRRRTLQNEPDISSIKSNASSKK